MPNAKEESQTFDCILIRVPNWRRIEGPRWYPVGKHSSGNVSIKRLHLNSRIKMSDEPFFERLLFWKERNVTYI
jgi:hypothetical protein